MTYPNDPAFDDESNMSSGGHVHDRGYKNLTKREYFAGLAIGMIARCSVYAATNFEDEAEFCVKMADALIAELSKEPK